MDKTNKKANKKQKAKKSSSKINENQRKKNKNRHYVLPINTAHNQISDGSFPFMYLDFQINAATVKLVHYEKCIILIARKLGVYE